MTHIYFVCPPEHQPQWPEVEPEYRLRKIDVAIGFFCLLVSGVVAITGIASALVLMGVL